MEKTTKDMRLVPTDELIPYANNARTHSSAQIAKIRASLREFGFINPIIIDGKNGIIAGHGRWEAAKAEGIEKVPCVLADHLTEAQKKAYVIADNRMALDAGWDEMMLKAELESLADDGFDLSLTGFTPKEIESIVDDPEFADDGFDIDAAEAKKPLAAQGDIWILGQHRLLVGDSTDPKNYEALMGDETADLIVTDPPYNVAIGTYDPRKGNTDDGSRTILNDDMGKDEFREFLAKCYGAMSDKLKKGGAFYIFHGDGERVAFQQEAEKAGLTVRQCLIWNKSAFTLGRQDYQWKHEPCLYGWKDGAGHYFVNDRTQATVIDEANDELEKRTKKELIELVRSLIGPTQATTVIDEDKPNRSALHPTMKPIRLIGRLVANSSKRNEIVLDPFGGSGSTLIACDQAGRRCRTIELDERYASAIVERYAERAGKEAISVIRGGKAIPFKDIDDGRDE